MREAREEASLHAEALAQELHFAVVERKRLEREACAEPLVLDFVHLGHAALPEQPHDAVRAYHCPFGKHADIIAKRPRRNQARRRPAARAI